MPTTKEKIQWFGIMMIMKAAYHHLIRPLVKKAVDDPDETWDDYLMQILDRLFDYKE